MAQLIFYNSYLDSSSGCVVCINTLMYYVRMCVMTTRGKFCARDVYSTILMLNEFFKEGLYSRPPLSSQRPGLTEIKSSPSLKDLKAKPRSSSNEDMIND